MKKLVIGILAHVDAGKTTLSEAMLYTAGVLRKLGRVDNRDAFLDTNELERERGITIFSKQARLSFCDMQITLLDTPGHVDFSAEMERTLQVLDYAILVISGADGVQGHTRTLWRLLRRYHIPVFLFVNKMDQAGTDKQKLLQELKEDLSENCIDFTAAEDEAFYDELAMCAEEAMDEFLGTDKVGEDTISALIRKRAVFPCFFGSALKLQGVQEFLEGMDRFTRKMSYQQEFGARVFKIARDEQGNRLTYLKITGGSLKVRTLLSEQKVNQIRLYSGVKFEAVQEAEAGEVCAVTGLTETYPGEGFGVEKEARMPLLEPVLTYQIILPPEVNAAVMLPKLRLLEEEEPELHIEWDERMQEIRAQLMGEVQTEILKRLIEERFQVQVEFGAGSIVYKETIMDTVEGVGHFEPLRHYSEVHLLMEPGLPGSGLEFDAACSEDMLDRNWQRLILTHLKEKEHKGVLTGSAITDMKITLVAGRAHQKHTEGGDFREATYRAVRQGLMQAHSILLEPYYEFVLEIPEQMVGRAMTDIERMQGTFLAPVIKEGTAILTGQAPVSAMQDYHKEVVAYTRGHGRLLCSLKGYEPCHNAEEVIAEIAYEPEHDPENPSGSVFCAHGAGFAVSWEEVTKYMHLESVLGKKDTSEVLESRPIKEPILEEWIDEEEIETIFARTFYANKTDKSTARKKFAPVRKENISGYTGIRNDRPKGTEKKEEYLLVDGYNVIFAWTELKELAAVNIDGARNRLLDIMCNYQGIKKCSVIVVFDAYRVQGHPPEIMNYHNIHVVYTKEAETADQYIEKFAHENARKYRVTVATSDGLEQIIIRGQGCLLLSARELLEEIRKMEQEMRENYLHSEKRIPGDPPLARLGEKMEELFKENYEIDESHK